MPQQSPVELSPRYYRGNFLQLCDSVESRYGDLLLATERDYLAGFRALSVDAQCLYVRLVSRVGPWFRTELLNYPEIDDVGKALTELETTGMAQGVAGLEVQELGRLYTRAELREVFAIDGVKAARTKVELLNVIDAMPDSPISRLRQLTDHYSGRLIEVVGLDIVELLQLLFFGNRYQSLTDFVLADLGLNRYFPYELDQETRSFNSRAAVEEYLACGTLADDHRRLTEAGDKPAMLELVKETLALELQSAAARRRWHRHCNALARELERCGESAKAFTLYAGSMLPPARERRARISERAGQFSEARELCGEILTSPWSEQEKEAASRILYRVERALGETPPRRPKDEFKRLDIELPRTSEPVETRVAAKLASDWQSVHFVENKLMNALFGLAFWEQIFAPVVGAFNNAYQGGPADMFEPGFRSRRQDLIGHRFEELRDRDLRAELTQIYRRYAGYRNHWISWGDVDEDLVGRACVVIPKEHLLAVWERILFDPRENRAGFPDLLALGEVEGNYFLIEVKGPGDTLRDNQKRWLRFFSEQGLPATVAWVRWSDA
jgi:hypothetical protein